MSHFSTIQTKIKDKTALARALVHMGFKEQVIELFDSPVTLKNYSGSDSNFKAEIRIKGAGWGNQNAVGGYKNDLGFERAADGTFVAHVDGHNQQWRERLERQYSREVIKGIAREKGFFIEEEVERGDEIFLKVQSAF
jgi:hypothetical protein